MKLEAEIRREFEKGIEDYGWGHVKADLSTLRIAQHPKFPFVWYGTWNDVSDQGGPPWPATGVYIDGPTGFGDYNGFHMYGGFEDLKPPPPCPILEDEKGTLWRYTSEQAGYDVNEEPLDEQFDFRPYNERGYAAKRPEPRPVWAEGELIWPIAFSEGGYGSWTCLSDDGTKIEQFYA